MPGSSNGGDPRPARSLAVKKETSPFWTFSLSVYRDPGVRTECLDLQDLLGVDVNLLLFCAFIGAVHGAALPDREIEAAASLVRSWHHDVVGSLRTARQTLKPLATGTSPIAVPAAKLRADVKASELEAEQIEQMMLERWSKTRIDGWERRRPADAVADNIRMLFATCAGAARQPELPRRLLAAALAAAPEAGS
jgi:uncharacterized protein (TIGR02444 family)